MRQVAPLFVVLFGLCVGALRADTLVVDADGGPDADFLTIQAAVDAAAPGDVLLVRPALYDGFVLDKPLRVLGVPEAMGAGVGVLGTIEVRDIPAGQVAALVQLSTEFLRIEGCDGTVFHDIVALLSPDPSQGPDDLFCIEVHDSADVRFRQLGVNPGTGSGRGGMLVDASWVEMEGTAIDGARGAHGELGAPNGAHGGPGIVVRNAGELRFHNGRARGGKGGDALFSTTEAWHGGDGGDALVVEPGSRLVLGGIIHTQVYGGWVGRGSLLHAPASELCPLEGAPGAGLRVAAGASARVAPAIVIEGGVSFCSDDGPPVVNAGEYVVPNPADLNLHWEGGVPQIGLSPKLEINGAPGTVVALFLGLDPLQLSIFKWKGNPLLVAPLIITNPVTMPAGGQVSLPATVPPSVPVGLTLISQAAGQRLDGSFQLSNSSTGVTVPPAPPICEPIPCNPEK